MYDGSRDAREFRIRVGNEQDAWFHEKTLELDGETANEETPIDDVPAYFTIEIDGAVAEERDIVIEGE
ncbi:hypothetical protein [Natrialba asiatica]|uniref:Uncharacterized protein n=1 Tax=Natrialba asiatica (strain ATCC 700177 / DSM 12278 / JCM 9576 / FERM P-10747 / NBRC 102637 / 172P1) TaxID=29540 RepID=M0AWI6_NATA1|nr:hypothetical protein [Natrialba asiatica]ELZ02692.1 hypothetical protein C481_08491 [Natrialba asiatica DSM 12278]